METKTGDRSAREAQIKRMKRDDTGVPCFHKPGRERVRTIVRRGLPKTAANVWSVGKTGGTGDSASGGRHAVCVLGDEMAFWLFVEETGLRVFSSQVFGAQVRCIIPSQALHKK